jgi:hypothetical protein
MRDMLHSLFYGDPLTLDRYKQAHRAWADFFTELETADVGTVSARLYFFQPVVEKIFGGREIGHSMMAWTAFAAMYDGKGGWGAHERRARELVAAFEASICSPEVKAEARDAAAFYKIQPHPEFSGELVPGGKSRSQQRFIRSA